MCLPKRKLKMHARRRTEMGKIIVSENVSLDGIVQDPIGDEGFRHGGWFGQYGGKDLEEWGTVETEEALAAEALLLGRRTDEMFAGLWLSRDGRWADRLNSMPKYVVSSTLGEPSWSNATGFKGVVLKGDVVTEVSELKQRLDGDIVVYGSARLVHTLMEHDLVDEVRLTVYPVVLGDGERLFTHTGDKQPMRLTGMRTLGEGLAYLTYERTRDV
jgi:dihydrofolate reductase